MKAEIKKQWVEALRSGEYAQTKGFLDVTEAQGDTPVGYCCLGVLCALAEQEGLVNSTRVPSDGFTPGHREFYGTAIGDHDLRTSGMLPEAVAIWAGLLDDAGDPDEDPGVPGGDGHYLVSLSSLNDDGASFEEIASLIEANL